MVKCYGEGRHYFITFNLKRFLEKCYLILKRCLADFFHHDVVWRRCPERHPRHRIILKHGRKFCLASSQRSSHYIFQHVRKHPGKHHGCGLRGARRNDLLRGRRQLYVTSFRSKVSVGPSHRLSADKSKCRQPSPVITYFAYLGSLRFLVNKRDVPARGGQ